MQSVTCDKLNTKFNPNPSIDVLSEDYKQLIFETLITLTFLYWKLEVEIFGRLKF